MADFFNREALLTLPRDAAECLLALEQMLPKADPADRASRLVDSQRKAVELPLEAAHLSSAWPDSERDAFDAVMTVVQADEPEKLPAALDMTARRRGDAMLKSVLWALIAQRAGREFFARPATWVAHVRIAPGTMAEDLIRLRRPDMARIFCADASGRWSLARLLSPGLPSYGGLATLLAEIHGPNAVADALLATASSHSEYAVALEWMAQIEISDNIRIQLMSELCFSENAELVTRALHLGFPPPGGNQAELRGLMKSIPAHLCPTFVAAMGAERMTALLPAVIALGNQPLTEAIEAMRARETTDSSRLNARPRRPQGPR